MICFSDNPWIVKSPCCSLIPRRILPPSVFANAEYVSHILLGVLLVQVYILFRGFHLIAMLSIPVSSNDNLHFPNCSQKILFLFMIDSILHYLSNLSKCFIYFTSISIHYLLFILAFPFIANPAKSRYNKSVDMILVHRKDFYGT